MTENKNLLSSTAMPNIYPALGKRSNVLLSILPKSDIYLHESADRFH